MATVVLSGIGAACTSTDVNQVGLSWKPCGPVEDSLECTSLVVPRKHGSTDTRTVTLAVIRSPAVGSDRREGTLFVHVGGPGIPHLGALSKIRKMLGGDIDRWDLVALDTRGTPGSHSFECGADVESAMIGRLDCSSLAEFDSSWSTADSVVDLEELRVLIGDSRSRFIGWSYGATLGAAWIERYPNALERVVLDAPGSPWMPWSVQLRARFDAMDALAPEILDGFELSADKGIGVALEMAMYEPSLWADFRLANAGDADRRNLLIARRLGLMENGDSGGISAQVAVRCSDLTPIELDRVLELRTSPINGIGLAIESACVGLSHVVRKPMTSVVGDRSFPLIVVGARGDIASPFPVVQSVAKLLGGRLIVVDGSHHTSVGYDSLATREVQAFLAG